MRAPRLISPLSNGLSLCSYDPVQVGYMQEACIAVDEDDKVLGQVSKVDAHAIPGMALHRAFSVFAFTPERKLILQKRSDSKITFPGLWTNTCCSHPLHNAEELDGASGVKRAAVRKLAHELNISGVSQDECLVLGRYLYKASMSDSPWGEHEMDYGIVIRNLAIDRVVPNPEEVSEICAVGEEELARWIKAEPASFSPWFSLFFRQAHLSDWWKRLNVLESVADLKITRLN